jgi:hyperosmotically inducible protein
MPVQITRPEAVAAAAAFMLLGACTSEQTTPAAARTTQGDVQAHALVESKTVRPVAQVADDAIITGKVKAALVEVEGVKVSDVNVDTINGTVTLKGFVENVAQAEHAIQLAQTTEGVRGVSNQLVVKATP